MITAVKKSESEKFIIEFSRNRQLKRYEAPHFLQSFIDQQDINILDYDAFILSFDYVYSSPIDRFEDHLLFSKSINGITLEFIGKRTDVGSTIVIKGNFRSKAIKSLKASKLIEVIINEVRNPIVGLVATSDLYLNYGKEFNLDNMEYFGITREYAQKLSLFVDQVITFLKLENNEIDYFESPLHIRSIINQVINANLIHLADSKIQLDSSLDFNTFCLGNEELVHIAIRNIVLNACYYTEGTPIVTISHSKNGIHSYINISDKGLGINPEIAFDIFKHFFRSHKEKSKNNAHGIGLGLSLVREIMKHQKGKIHIRSKEGLGTTVSLLLPQLTIETL